MSAAATPTPTPIPTASPSSSSSSSDDTICPICLEDLPNQVNGKDLSRALCCGKLYCRRCVQNGQLHQFGQVLQGDDTPIRQGDVCPMCRTPLPRTPEEALAMVMKHVNDGNNNSKAWAQFNLANRYETGRGVPQSWDKAHEWHLKAAAQGFAASEHALGLIYSNDRRGSIKKDIPKAIEWLEKASAKGHAASQCSLAHLYTKHSSGPQQQHHRRSAKELFDAAAAQKYDVAECDVGYFYEHGINGYPRDLAKAKEFYQRAALQGNDTAQFNLGGLLFNVDGNIPAALFWLRTLCESPNKASASDNTSDAMQLKTQLEGGLRITCGGCHKRGETLTLRCAGCQTYYYCSKDCQVRHWKAQNHKTECKHVQELKKLTADIKQQELHYMLTNLTLR